MSFLFGGNVSARHPSSSSNGINMGVLSSSATNNNTPSYLSYSYSNLRLEPKDHIKRLHIFSKFFLVTSAFFWCWAAHNTKMKMGKNKSFDIGLVSFFISALSSLYLFRKTRCGVEGFVPTGSIGRIFVSLSHIIVALSYGLGLYMAATVGKKIYIKFATYCLVFMFIWSYSAYIGWKLVGNTLDIGLEEEDEDDYDYDDEDDMSGSGGGDFDNNFFDDFDDDEQRQSDYMFNFSKNSMANEDGGGGISRRSKF